MYLLSNAFCAQKTRTMRQLVTGRLDPALSPSLSVSMFRDWPARPLFAGRKSEWHSGQLLFAALIYDPDRVGASELFAVNKACHDQLNRVTGGYSHQVFSVELDNEFAIVSHHATDSRSAFTFYGTDVNVLFIITFRQVNKDSEEAFAV
jgi:hypothetical protein